MRILLTAYPDTTPWTFVTELAGGLERDGVQIVIAAMGGPLAEQQRAQLRALRHVEFYESTYRPEWTQPDEREIERAGEWLLDLAQRRDVDLVHLTELSHGALPWRARPVVSVWQRPVQTANLAGRAAATIREAAVLVATSRAAVIDIQRAYGAFAGATTAIPFGRSSSVFGNHGKEPMIVTLCDRADHDRLADVTNVAARISWPLFVIGDSQRATAGTSLANVHCLGDLSAPDTAAVLGRASVFVEPARSATLGYAVLDAALHGCALVLRDTADLREQWDGAATFIDVSDADALRSTLIWLMNDAEARADLGARAQQRAAGFTAERMAAAYLALYIDLTLGASAALGNRVRRGTTLDRSA
ncbi:MAG: glycosyltransferase family 4 protein [Gemmatimonadota bacterium]